MAGGKLQIWWYSMTTKMNDAEYEFIQMKGKLSVR